MTNDIVSTGGVRTSSWGTLRVTEDRLEGGTVRLRLAGELDLATGVCLRAAAPGVGWGRCACYEIDLRGLTFVDCSGMRAVADVVRSIEDVGGCVAVTAGRAVERIARLIGADSEVVFA